MYFQAKNMHPPLLTKASTFDTYMEGKLYTDKHK